MMYAADDVESLIDAAESMLALFREGPPGEQAHILASFPCLKQMEESLERLKGEKR